MTFSTQPLSRPGSSNFATQPDPEWLALAREGIHRLTQELIDRTADTWDPVLESIDDADIPDVIAPPPGTGSPAAPLSTMDDHPAGQEASHLRPTAAKDPVAITGTDAATPRIRPPATKLALLVRLAATLGSIEERDAMLGPGAITLIEGIPNDIMDFLKAQLRHLIPDPWKLATSRSMSTRNSPSLVVLAPEVLNGRVTQYADRAFSKDLSAAIDSSVPILILLPDEATAPEALKEAQIRHVALAPMTVDMLLTCLGATHGSMEQIDVAALRALLPGDITWVDRDPVALAIAMRARTARAVAEQIAARATQPPRGAKSGPCLEDLLGDGPAHRAARQIVADLQAWQAGEIRWQDMTRTVLFYGPPGTGKSWLARAMGQSADCTVIHAGFGLWQAAGHLGDLLHEMRKTFSDARAQKPSLIIIDEVDAVGSREGPDSHGQSYRTQVINGFLAELDSISREEGVILVGTSNDLGRIDPAVLRPGRFDLHCPVPLPDAHTLRGILHHCLPDWPDAELSKLATNAIGCSAADVDAVIRQARSAARAQQRNLTAEDLREVFRSSQPPAIDLRVAIHECGHAIACKALKLGQVRRIYIGQDGGGGVGFEAIPRHGTADDIRDRMCQLMAGRAAERTVLGDVSGGAGGGQSSDLAKTTKLASAIHTQLGLGLYGSTWLGTGEASLMQDPVLFAQIKHEVEIAEERAMKLLASHRPLLEEMAVALVRLREMGEFEANRWLSQIVEGTCSEGGRPKPC